MKGEVKVFLGGQDCVLVYDWDAILLLEQKFGADKLNEALSSSSIYNLAHIMECGFAKHHPKIKAQSIFEISPCIMDCKKAVDEALSLSYFGTKTPKEKANEDIKKKMLRVLWWSAPISLLLGLAYLLIFSGH